jgi:hypothetical protein
MRKTTLLLLLVVTSLAHADDRAAALAEFERFDRDQSGYLSLAEMAACGCASLDKNGDLILMPAEYLEGRGTKAAAPSARPPSRSSVSGSVSGSASKPAPNVSGGWRRGDRVKAGCYGNMKEGVVDRVEGGRAWVSFADEPNCDGFRDLTALKPAADAGRPRAGAQPASGGAPPSGVYVCQKISGSSLIGLGNLEIKGNSYSGIGDGAFAPFSLDGAGEITWTKGLQGFPDGWTVTSSRYAGLDYLGRPLIKIGYRTTRGSADLIDCVRE